MADEPANPTQQILDGTTKEAVSNIDWEKVNGALNQLKSLFVQLGKSAGGDLISGLTEAADGAASTIGSVFKGISDPDQILSQMEAVKKGFESSFGKLMIDAGISEGSLRSIKDDLFGALDVASSKDIAVGIGTSKVIDGAKDSMRSFKRLEDSILSTSRRGAAALQGMISPLSSNRDFSDLSSNLRVYRQEILKTMSLTKMSREEAIRGFTDMAKAGVDMERLSKISLKVEGGQEIDGLAASMMIAKSVGLDMSDVAKQLNTQMRALQKSPKEAGEVFGILTRVQADTTMSMGNVLKAVESGQDKMKMYGDATRSSATIFKAFLNSLGRGREELAKPLFDSVIGGIQKLDREFGKSAFLGMDTEMGQGAGAIGAGLRVEEAFTSGEGIEEVLKSVQGKIEQFSGTNILTRKEAIDSGQEQQYEIQRRILQQLLGVQGGQQQELVLQAFQGSDFDKIKESLAPSKKDFLTTGLGTDTIGLEQGRIGAALNKLDAVAEASVTDFAVEALSTSGTNFLKSGQIFGQSVDQFKKFVGEMPATFMNAMKDRGAEEEARSAAKSIAAKGVPSGGITAEQLSGFSAQRDNLKLKTLEELSGFSAQRGHLGLKSAEELSAFSYQRDAGLGRFNWEDAKFDTMFETQGAASPTNESGGEAQVTSEKELDLKINFITEIDDDAVIRIQPIVERISEESARRVVDEKTSAPRE